MMVPWSDLQWAHPWAWVVAALPWLLALSRRAGARRRGLPAHVDPAMRAWALREVHGAGGIARACLQGLLWLLLAAALAGPRQALVPGGGARQARQRMRLMIVLQVPDADSAARLVRVRMALQELQARLHGERLCLTVFSRAAARLLPCTGDSGLLDAAVSRVDAGLLRGIPGPGLPGALALARRELSYPPRPPGAVLLVAGVGATQGLHAPGRRALRQQAQALRDAHVPVFLVWTAAGDPGPAVLRPVRRSGGRWARIDAPALWSTLYDHGIARLPAGPAPPAVSQAWREWYAVPLLAALLVLLVLKTLDARGRAQAPGAGLALGLVCVCALWAALHAPLVHADPLPARRQAWLAWSRGDYAACAVLYGRLAGYDARIGQGACDYRGGHFQAARSAFRLAMLDAPGDRRRAVALYDLGNASFHVQGGLREALDAYSASLVLWPVRAATLRNLRLARAQWVQEHPEYELSGMRKRGAASTLARFGDTSDLTPSRMPRHRPGAQVRDPGQALAATGRLQGGPAPRAPAASAMQVSPDDARVARRAMALLHDHRRELLRALIRRDSRRAAELLRAR